MMKWMKSRSSITRQESCLMSDKTIKIIRYICVACLVFSLTISIVLAIKSYLPIREYVSPLIILFYALVPIREYVSPLIILFYALVGYLVGIVFTLPTSIISIILRKRDKKIAMGLSIVSLVIILASGLYISNNFTETSQPNSLNCYLDHYIDNYSEVVDVVDTEYNEDFNLVIGLYDNENTPYNWNDIMDYRADSNVSVTLSGYEEINNTGSGVYVVNEVGENWQGSYQITVVNGHATEITRQYSNAETDYTVNYILEGN